MSNVINQKGKYLGRDDARKQRCVPLPNTESPCRCLSCIYLLCAIKQNEDGEGNYDLKIYCQLIDCPMERQSKEKKAISDGIHEKLP